MRIETAENTDDLADRAASWFEGRITRAIEARGRALIALSGGGTPVPTFYELGRRPLAWERVHVFQVDERIAPPGDPARNISSIEDALGSTGAVIHPMPVEKETGTAAAEYAGEMHAVAGGPIGFDAMQLGIGDDGHTASLFPGDPALEYDGEVAVVAPHAGWARMTITFPVINRSREILWIVSEEEKRGVISRLIAGDRSIPAGRVTREGALLMTDLRDVR